MSSPPLRPESLSGDEKYDEKVDTASFHSDAVKYDTGVDVAVQLVAGHADDAELSKEEFKRIRSKLDWNLLPMLWLLYTRTYWLPVLPPIVYSPSCRRAVQFLDKFVPLFCSSAAVW
jgi:hypothetical protein